MRVFLLVLGVLLMTVSCVESNSCTYKTKTTTSCGLWGWGRCQKYKTATRYCSWTRWTDSTSSACSVTCGSGTKTVSQTRYCSACSLTRTQTVSRTCTLSPCPVDGGWSDWTAWMNVTKCTALCGGGHIQQSRDRNCSNPEPQYGGANCSGPSSGEQTVNCSMQACTAQQCNATNTHIADEEDPTDYYQCINADNAGNQRAILMSCPPGTVFKKTMKNCGYTDPPTTTTATTTPACTNGVITVSDDCSSYTTCANNMPYTITCPAGTLYDAGIHVCNHASSVTCGNSSD